MAASISSLSAALKNFYIGPIQDQLNNEIEMFKLMEDLDVEWAGKAAIIPMRTGRNDAVGAIAENAQLMQAGQEEYKDLTVTAGYIFGRFQFTDQAVSASAKAAGSFGTIIQLEMEKLTEDVKVFCNFRAFTGGRVLGFVWQKNNLSTFQYSGRSRDVGTGVGNTVKFVRLDTYATVGVATQLNTVSATSITLNAAINTAAVPAGVVMAVVSVTGTPVNQLGVPNGNYDAEPIGIFGNLAQQTHFGQARTATTSWNGTVVTQGGVDAFGALDLSDLQGLMDTILDLSGKEIDYWWTNPTNRQGYTSLLQGTNAANLFTTTREGDKAGDAGFSAIGYNGKAIRTSQGAPKGSWVGMHSKDWKRLTLQSGGFADFDGKVLNKVPNTAAYEGFWRMYYNTVCLMPRSNGIITAVQP
jgi:hypothetical protein